MYICVGGGSKPHGMRNKREGVKREGIRHFGFGWDGIMRNQSRKGRSGERKI